MGIDIKNQFFLPEMGLEFGLWRLKKKSPIFMGTKKL